MQIFTLKEPRSGERARVPIRAGDAEGARLSNQVSRFNEWVAEHDVRGCLPPRFTRVFTGSWMLGGRWYAEGREGVYQRMSEAERLAIAINGEPVAEADVRASHLSIMHGLLGRALPDLEDFYQFPGVPRAVIKAWITATLGKGSPVVRWAARAAAQEPLVQHYDAREVGGLICERYPFMRHPAEAVAEAAGLGRLGLIGTPRQPPDAPPHGH